MSNLAAINNFKKADAEVTRIENEGGTFAQGYGATATTAEYNTALAAAQAAYNVCVERGIQLF